MGTNVWISWQVGCSSLFFLCKEIFRQKSFRSTRSPSQLDYSLFPEHILCLLTSMLLLCHYLQYKPFKWQILLGKIEEVKKLTCSCPDPDHFYLHSVFPQKGSNPPKSVCASLPYDVQFDNLSPLVHVDPTTVWTKPRRTIVSICYMFGDINCCLKFFCY